MPIEDLFGRWLWFAIIVGTLMLAGGAIAVLLGLVGAALGAAQGSLQTPFAPDVEDRAAEIEARVRAHIHARSAPPQPAATAERYEPEPLEPAPSLAAPPALSRATRRRKRYPRRTALPEKRAA